jgi:hypothetical protein
VLAAHQKRPKWADTPNPQKKVPPVVAPDYRDQNPSWRVREMMMVDPFGWHRMTAPEIAKIHSRLGTLERSTWREILQPSTGRRRHHYMPVDEICNAARQQLEDKKLADTDSLVSLRIGQSERVWGILQGASLLLLWWDPDHLIYEMNIANN